MHTSSVSILSFNSVLLFFVFNLLLVLVLSTSIRFHSIIAVNSSTNTDSCSTCDMFREERMAEKRTENKTAISASCFAYKMTVAVCVCVMCVESVDSDAVRIFSILFAATLWLPLLLLFSMTTNNFSSIHRHGMRNYSTRGRCVCVRSWCMWMGKAMSFSDIPVYLRISNKLWIYFIRLCVVRWPMLFALTLWMWYAARTHWTANRT